MKKVVWFYDDNCNTNFGGVKRRGKTTFFFFGLKQEIGQNLIGIGCTANIVHSWVENAVSALQFDIEARVKICKYTIYCSCYLVARVLWVCGCGV